MHSTLNAQRLSQGMIHRIVIGCCITFVNPVDHAHSADVDFDRDVRPILANSCFACHGPDPKTREGDLRLDTFAGALKRPEGDPVILPGKPAESPLLQRVTSEDPDERMPPPDFTQTLTTEQIATLKQWIAEGAQWSQHWSFVPPRRPKLPAVQQSDWPRNPIDFFVLRRLESAGLAPSVPASREALIRRLSFDLTGLAPTLAEVDAFLADQGEDAYERLVDRLLQSPRYGEHRALPWLEAARYADTNGYQQDRTRTMWPWRDWVVRQLNENTPFDQFTIEQLAGDLLPNATREQQLATGFHRNHMLNGEGGRIAEESRVEYVLNRVETTGTVWLGLSVGCARCHDHKYDPLSQREYYELSAYFNNIDERGNVDRGGNANPVMKVPTTDQLNAEQELVSEIAELNRQLESTATPQSVEKWADELRQNVGSSARQLSWRVLEPTKMISTNGATISQRDDGSLLVTGENPEKDDYQVEAVLDVDELTGLRIEALPHPPFTNGAFARSDSGNFVLTEVEATLWLPGNSEPVRLSFGHGEATYTQGSFSIEQVFDGNPGTGWAVWTGDPKTMATTRTAVLRFAKPAAAGEGARLVLNLRHQTNYKFHNLGSFRLSVTSNPEPSLKMKSEHPALVLAALALPANKRSDVQQRALRDYFKKTSAPARQLQQQIEQKTAELNKTRDGFVETMVMRERARPRETYVLQRGVWDKPDKSQLLGPEVPDCLPPLEKEARPDRLALARWLVEDDHPLTARVTINRLWQQVFGRGLVETPEDFGSQGQRASHPELLDWLATEFVRSGWDRKHMLRLIVTSATYRQSSHVTPDLLERDPINRWLARFPRFRLTSQAIRDQALQLGGLLAEQLGGPPVKPYQPDGIWQDFSLGKIKYEKDRGASLYRRSLYTFWRRSVGPTLFFDTSPRQVCTVVPRRTNTPLHALTLLNDTTYVEAARAFAARVIATAGEDPRERLQLAFRLATSRRPTDMETAALLAALKDVLQQYRSSPGEAKKLLETGDSPNASSIDAVELAAYASVMNILLNLDEVITKE